MAAVNSSVLACKYVAAEASLRTGSAARSPAAVAIKSPAIRAQKVEAAAAATGGKDGRRAAVLGLAGLVFTTAAAASSANAGIIEEYLEKSKANKELNDRKRLATSGANFARAYTVEFGTCKFPENFTGCQDLAKQKKVPFLTDDLELECEGKDKYKCGSNVFWKW